MRDGDNNPATKASSGVRQQLQLRDAGARGHRQRRHRRDHLRRVRRQGVRGTPTDRTSPAGRRCCRRARRPSARAARSPRPSRSATRRPGDTQPEIVAAASCDSVIVFEPNGAAVPNFPIWEDRGHEQDPSPAIADINNDGFNDIVFQSTNGGLYVFTRTGPVAPASATCATRSSRTALGAARSSPTSTGDGRNDMIVGDGVRPRVGVLGLNGTTRWPASRSSSPARGARRGGGGRHRQRRQDRIVISGWDKNVYASGTTTSPFGRTASRRGRSSTTTPAAPASPNAPLFVGGARTVRLGAPRDVARFAPVSPNPVAGKAA